MIPSNNLSVLPWYTSIDQQNARKWWVYNKVYPLFTPAGYMLPFQILTPHYQRGTEPKPGTLLERGDWDNGYYDSNNVFHSAATLMVNTYDVRTMSSVYFTRLPYTTGYPDATMAIGIDDNDNVTGVFPKPQGTGYTGVWNLPANTTRIRVLVRNPGYSQSNAYVSTVIYEAADIVNLFEIYDKNDAFVGDFTDAIKPYMSIKQFPELNYDVLIFGGQLPIFSAMNNGQYYAKLNDGYNTYYSEIFTVVNDISGYLKLEWWDNDDFVMDAGTIVYKYADGIQFKNVLYLCSDIAKPEYTFDDEVEERDGYTFPTKQISKKVYHFAFFASEYLLDVMRFVRMADYAQITSHGQLYTMDTFLITPEWEDNGDVAGVDAEFTTATVAKKIGVGYVKAQRGDFNDDFNNDFNNQQ